MYAEGLAEVEDGNAFLNPYSKLSRDVSVALLSGMPREISVLDATSATGIRGIRYWKELGIRDITLLDINEEACRSIRSNIGLNGIDAKDMNVINDSIQRFANNSGERFDVVDLDPFGSPAPNLYDIMKLVKRGGMLMVSATDTAVLCGAHARACMKRYGSVPVHDELCHEAGLRILLGYVCRIAAQFELGMHVIFSLVHRHFIRIAVRLKRGVGETDSSLKELGFAYHCRKCGWFGYDTGFLPKRDKCGACSNDVTVFGILWLGDLYDDKARHSVYDYFKSKGFESLDVIGRANEEVDLPFYYSVPKLTKILKVPSVSPIKVSDGLRASGFRASLTHISSQCIKTDAGIQDIKEQIIAVFKDGISTCPI